MVGIKETDQPLVSIVIPTYEHGHVLPNSIDSVLKQTVTDLEIVVVDDGSTDNTEVVVSRYEDSRINYISHRTNKGLSAARNTGIEQSTGKYVAFLDADDEWAPKLLEQLIHALEHSRAEVVYSDGYTIRGESTRRIRTPDVEDPNRHYIKIFISQTNPLMSSVIVRRESLGNIRFDESLQGGASEDLHFLVRVFKECTPMKIPEPLVHYRYSPTSLSHSDAARYHETHIRAMNNLVKQLPELKPYYDEKQATDFWKSAFRFAQEGEYERARRLSHQSIETAPRKLPVIPAYGLLLLLKIPLGLLRGYLLRLSEAVYRYLLRTGVVQ